MAQPGAGHWREYAMEGVLLGLFIVAACGFATLLEHPASPAHLAVPNGTARRVLMGLAMASTAIALITSPWGRQSGAHLNPSLTLTYFRLGKIAGRDALGYVTAQFAGGIAGALAVRAMLGMLAGHPAVRFAATVPGARGAAGALVAEACISFVLMWVVLETSNRPQAARYTPLCCAALIAIYITVEAPLSGMSMNPARSTASALAASVWTALWVYFVAPPLGMLAAAETYVRRHGAARVRCAKLDHRTTRRCIFRCGYAPAAAGAAAAQAVTRAAAPASNAANDPGAGTGRQEEPRCIES
jgi:aquaporin Z